MFAALTAHAISAEGAYIDATIAGTGGTVEVRDPGAKFWRGATQGEPVGTGQDIRTGKNSYCIIRWAGGNVARIEGETEFGVEAMSIKPSEAAGTWRLALRSGKMYGRASAPDADPVVYTLATPSARLEVMGALYSVAVDGDGGTTVEVAKGTAVLYDKKFGWVKLYDRHSATVKKWQPVSKAERMSWGAAGSFDRVEGVGNPGLDIDNPGADYDGAPFALVSGRATPGSTVTVNGGPAQADKNGFFSATARLEGGANKLVVRAVNRFGLASEKSMTLTYDPGKQPAGGDAGVSMSIKPRALPLPESDTTAPRVSLIQPYELFRGGEAGCTGPEQALVCNVVGRTEPGAEVTINGRDFKAEQDGSFNASVLLGPRDSAIVVRARDAAGNVGAAVVQRAFSPTKIVYLSVSASPSTIQADNVSTSVITVTGINLIGEPVDGTVVNVTAGAGGTLSAGSVALSQGNGTVTFRAGVGAVRTTVPITIESAGVTASTSITLTPDAPPMLEDRRGGRQQ